MREYTTPGEVSLPDEATLLDPVWHHAAETPDAVMLAYRDGDRFVDVTAAQFADVVQRLATGLVGLGVEVGERVAIMAKTRVEWTYLDYAIMAAGGTTVPIYETSSPEQIEWILSDSGATTVFFETPELKAEFDAVSGDLGHVSNVFVIEEDGLEQLVSHGSDVDPAEITRRGESVGSDSIAQIIYTSGTTGRPKGCVCTHRNLRWDAVQVNEYLAELFTGDTSTLLFLPLAHSFGKLVQGSCIESRTVISYATSPQHLVEEMPMVKPTFLMSVPRIFEKVYNGAVSKAREEGKGRIFEKAVDVAIRYSRERQAGGVSLSTRAQHLLFDRLVYGKLRERFGGRIEYSFSGGAALGERLGHFFNGVGITILEGWGLTETSAGATVNSPTHLKIGTVGRPFPGCSVGIADDGEVLVKGGNVFQGYWNNEEATREVFDDGGWFRTGDIGELDRDGFLSITGRKKELIVTAGGKNVAPSVLEDRIRSHRLVSQSMVVGDDQPFVAALVTIDPDEFPRWAKEHDKEGKSVADLTDDPDLRAEIDAAIRDANEAVSRAESVREFRILPEDFSIEGGELTPTLKVKRRVVSDKYGYVIDDIYSGSRGG